MKFGVFYELQLPRPWTRESEYRLYKNALDQLSLADRLGYDYAWQVEHHFLEEYSHSSAPEVFLAAASQRTKNIRLGHGIVQLPTNHPARVAERVATLDLVSDGRVELGLGEGASLTELEPFGRRYSEKRGIWEDAVRALLPMFWEPVWEYHGSHFDFPARNVLPKPVQKPHPPLWVACSQLATIEMAGRRGMGALGFQFVSPEAAVAWVNAYYNAFIHAFDPLAAYATNPNIAVVSQFMCCETEEEAMIKAEGNTFFTFALLYYGFASDRLDHETDTLVPGATNLWDEYQKWKLTPDGQKAHRARGLIGTPQQLREKLRKFEMSNVDQVILLNQAGKNNHEDICASLELFAAEVMGEFKERDAEHQEWKRRVLAGEIVLAEVDTAPYATALGRDKLTNVVG